MLLVFEAIEDNANQNGQFPGYRSDPNRSIHATGLDFPRRRILYIPRKRSGFWKTWRFRDVARDFTGLRRVGWYLDDCGVDVARAEEEWCSIDGGWARKGDFDG